MPSLDWRAVACRASHRAVEPARRDFRPVGFIFGHRDIAVLLGCDFLLGLASSFVGPFLSLFGEHEVGMGSAAFGLFMTLTSLSGIAISTMLARWSDTRFSRKSVLLLGACAGILGYLGYAFVRSPIWLTVIGSLFLGVAGITFSQTFALARELLARAGLPSEDAPLYMNVFRLFFALAWTVGPALASMVMLRFSYVGTFLVAALCFAALASAVAFLVPSRAPTKEAGRELGLRATLRSLARPELLAHFLGFVLVYACGSLCSVCLPLLVVETLGGGAREVGIVYSVSPFFELPLMLLFGALATKGRSAILIRAGVLLATAYYAALALVRAPWQIYPLQAISAAITAITQGVAITFFQDFLPEQVGTATNLYANASSLGRIAGFLLFARLAAVLGYRGIFLMCAGLCAAALLLMRAFRPDKRPTRYSRTH
jgi:SET family sugar efflux transporter-like MFS transporter